MRKGLIESRYGRDFSYESWGIPGIAQTIEFNDAEIAEIDDV